ncbi:hypothetical protein ACQPZJ_06630 [Actinoplanes sp. CA-054009]
MTQPLDQNKPWESGLTIVLGADPMDRKHFLGMNWISITNVHIEGKPPADNPGENKFALYRKLDGGTRQGYVSGYMGYPVPVQVDNPDNYLIFDGEINWYLGGGDSPHDKYVNEFLTSTNKALESGPTGTVLNADSLDQAAETYYNLWTWLGQAIQRLQAEIGKVDGPDTGFKGTAAGAFVETLENMRDELKLLQTDLKTNQDWVQMLHDNATAVRTFWTQVRSAWDDFYYHKPDPSKMVNDVVSQLKTQAQAMNGQPAATGTVTSWVFNLNFGNGEKGYDFLNQGVGGLNTDMQNFWVSNAANLDSTIKTQVTALRDSFDKTRMNMHETRTFVPPPTDNPTTTGGANGPGTGGLTDTNGDGKIDINDILGGNNGGNNGGLNGGGGGGGGGGANFDPNNIFGGGPNGGGNNGGSTGGGSTGGGGFTGGGFAGGGNNPGGTVDASGFGGQGPNNIFSATGDGLGGLNGDGSGTGGGGGAFGAGGVGGLGAFTTGGRNGATVTRNGQGNNGPTLDGLTDFTGGEDGAGAGGGMTGGTPGAGGPSTVDLGSLTGNGGATGNVPSFGSATGGGGPNGGGTAGAIGGGAGAGLPGAGFSGNPGGDDGPGFGGATGETPGFDGTSGTPGAGFAGSPGGGGGGLGGGLGGGGLGGGGLGGGGLGGGLGGGTSGGGFSGDPGGLGGDGSSIGDIGGGATDGNGGYGFGGDGASLPVSHNQPPNGFNVGPLGTSLDTTGMDFGTGAYGGNGTWATGGAGGGGGGLGGGLGGGGLGDGGLGGGGLGGGGLSGGGLGGSTGSGTPIGALGAGAAGVAAGTAASALTPGASGGYPPMMPPMGGMGQMGGNQEKERERTTWLAEDEEVWGTDPDVSPAVVGRDEHGDVDGTERDPWAPAPRQPATPHTPARGGGRAGNRGY